MQERTDSRVPYAIDIEVARKFVNLGCVCFFLIALARKDVSLSCYLNNYFISVSSM